VAVSPSASTTYGITCTGEGSATASVTVTVESGILFQDGFESGGLGAWSSSLP
jgi:hypothetical protein